jgi:hypothetical protein
LSAKRGIAVNVLLVGERPEAVDFTDPALPPGTTAEKIHAGLNSAMQEMAKRGWNADLCLINPDESGAQKLQESLDGHEYDCIVIGGGIRVPPKSLLFFEKVLNVVHARAPHAAIAFNTAPANTPDAAGRWLPPGRA